MSEPRVAGPTAGADERRELARRQLEAACLELRSSEGWQRFARARALLRGYSLNNTMLILAQRPDATTVASYRRWLELGRQVRRGERSLRIWAPSVRREHDESTGEETTSVRAFVLVPVFRRLPDRGAAPFPSLRLWRRSRATRTPIFSPG